jgi:hypothetical protein
MNDLDCSWQPRVPPVAKLSVKGSKERWTADTDCAKACLVNVLFESTDAKAYMFACFEFGLPTQKLAFS